jgi:hypothetical protein
VGRGQRQLDQAIITPLRGGGRSREQGRPADENLVRLELAAVLSDYDHWPTLQEFVEADRADLYHQAEETGGGQRWAEEFGLPFVPDEQDPEEQAVREELADFLRGFARWPTVAEFEMARRTTLYGKLLRHGGARRWAAEFGLPMLRQGRGEPDRPRTESARGRRPLARSGRSRHWTVELVRAALVEFLQDAEHFPSETEFRDAGEESLHRALSRFGGPAHWAAEFKLPRVSDLGRQRARDLHAFRAATAETRGLQRERRIRELEAFCAGRDYFPAHSEWAAAGREDLKEFVHRNGGVQEWSRRLGLPLRPAQDRRPYDLERALADGRMMIAEYGYIPGAQILQRRGLNKLYQYIRGEFNGDRAAFARRCG